MKKLYCKNDGVILNVVLLLLAFISIMIFGLAKLVQVGHSGVSSKQDLSLAQKYAYDSIFDEKFGATNSILSLENTLFSYPYISDKKGKTLETMTDEERYNLIYGTESNDGYFTIGCANSNNVKNLRTGLCLSINTIQSTAWLRSSELVTPPCSSYSKVTIISGYKDLPMLDDKKSRYSILYETGNKYLCNQPRYIIELLDDKFVLANLVTHARLYRVTSRAFGVNGDTYITLQAYFYVRCPLGKCVVSLLNSYFIY